MDFNTETEALAPGSPPDEGLNDGSPLYLVVRREDALEVMSLAAGSAITLGRSAEAGIVVSEKAVSREHARIRRKNGEIWLEDLGSRNGTLVNAKRIRGTARLRSGDVIRVGSLEVVIAAMAPGTHGFPRPSLDIEIDDFVVVDEKVLAVFHMARRLAATSTTVLVTGETGVGKEVLVQHLHAWSSRSEKQFVSVNAATIPDALLESELFGHQRGAFTGAVADKPGLLESAHGGTLLLDEIAELTPSAQVKLLRVLETHRIRRLGGGPEIELDVRVVCATHQNLEERVRSGAFREDLFYRIGTFVLHLPPLRERKLEIPLLSRHFARLFSSRLGLPEPSIGRDAAEALAAHDFPGNVRELRNAMEHAVVQAQGNSILREHLPSTIAAVRIEKRMPEQLADAEMSAIRSALEATSGNRTQAARRLGISRRALIYKLAKFGLGGVPRS